MVTACPVIPAGNGPRRCGSQWLGIDFRVGAASPPSDGPGKSSSRAAPLMREETRDSKIAIQTSVVQSQGRNAAPLKEKLLCHNLISGWSSELFLHTQVGTYSFLPTHTLLAHWYHALYTSSLCLVLHFLISKLFFCPLLWIYSQV